MFNGLLDHVEHAIGGIEIFKANGLRNVQYVPGQFRYVVLAPHHCWRFGLVGFHFLGMQDVTFPVGAITPNLADRGRKT